MNRSKATAALQRFREIDKKYKVRYDETKSEEDSSENTASLLRENDEKKEPRAASPLERREILKPTLSIKIPDTFADGLDTETSTSDDVSPSPRVSVVDKTPVATPRAKSISEIEEILDEGESIAEALEDSDSETSRAIGKKSFEYSKDTDRSLAITVEDSSMKNEDSKNNYSDDSFENESSDAESVGSHSSSKKYLALPDVCQKSSVREDEMRMKPREMQKNSGWENKRILDNGELSKRSRREETKIENRSDDDGELPNSIDVANTASAESHLRASEYSNITEKSDSIQDLSASSKIVSLANEQSELTPNDRRNSRPSEKNAEFESDDLSRVRKIINTPRSKSVSNTSEISSVPEEHDEKLSSARKSSRSQREKSELTSRNLKDSRSNDDFTINEKLSTSLRSVDSSRSKLDTNKGPVIHARTERSLSSESSKKHRKKSNERFRSSGNAPDADAFGMESGSRRDNDRETAERDVTLRDKEPEVGFAKIVGKARSSVEIRASRDTSRFVKKRISDRKKRYPISGDYRASKTREGPPKTSKSAPILRSNEAALFERKDRELERLRARMSDLHLERERQLLLCYMRDFDEDRKRLVLFSNQFHCPSKPKVSIIKPLEFPNVANFTKPDTTSLRCSFLLPDDNLELLKSRVAEIRQWLKDQFILYREYSDVAAAINAKYVTDAAAEKVSRSAVARSRRGTPEVSRYRESSRRQAEVAVGSDPEEATQELSGYGEEFFAKEEKERKKGVR